MSAPGSLAHPNRRLTHRLPRIAVVALALVSAAPARAADVGGAETLAGPQDGFDWSGLHAGVHGGYGRLGASGAFGGAAIGYDFRFDNVLIGVEGDLSGGGLDGRRSGGGHDIDAFGTIRARVGYAFERFVVYGTAGAAFASADYARGGRRDGAVHAGWTAGVGFEVELFGGLSAKAEYLYIDLDRRTFDVDGDPGLDADGGQFRLGLNYRF